MTTFSDADIDLAKLLCTRLKTAKSKDEREKVPEEIMRECSTSITEQNQLAIFEKFEKSYKKNLAACGGDADILARFLYMQLLSSNVSSRIPPPLTPSKKSGRPPGRWGSDAVGKLMLYIIVEDTLTEMRAEGTKRPKIKDAIARCIGVLEQHPRRMKVEAEISDYAARYSEAKKILKLSGKLGSI
jgi:hypothetical protein